MERNLQDITVTTPELQALLDISRSTVARLAKDGILPKIRRGTWSLAECVKAYVVYLHSMCQRAGFGNLVPDKDAAESGEDPDTMPVGERLKYWQAVRHQQHAEEHLQEIVAAMAKEYQAQLAKALAKLSQALSDADLPPATLRKLHAAFPRSTGTE